MWQSPSAHASVTVQVAVFPTISEAQLAYAEAVAKKKGVAYNPIGGIGDTAVIARASAEGLNTGGIYVQDGGRFFDVVYLWGTAPSAQQLVTAAGTVRDNLP